MLQAQHISFEVDSHGESLILLNNISFEVPTSHFMAIVGTSGCGKTTLLKTIAGINAETDGHFCWDGRNLAEDDFDPSEVGYVPQFSIAYESLTVDENVENSARLRIKTHSSDELYDYIDTALAETGLTEIADRQVKFLSGGQKRRLSLAMELVSQPRLLLCDEVTSGLDPQSSREMVKLLKEIAHQQQRVVILVTHSLEDLNDYDSVLVLHEGSVAYHGSPRGITHYFGVSDPTGIYKKLADQPGEKWAKSWEKHKEAYYDKIQRERAEKIANGEIAEATIQASSDDEKRDLDLPPIKQPLPADMPPLPHEVETDKTADDEAINDEKAKRPKRPGPISQFITLLERRWKIFFRDRTQLILQLVMIVLFPIMVALFSSKGQEPLNKYTSQRDDNIISEIQQKIAVEQNQMKVGSAVSGIIMFEIILLGLMGSNNSAREIAGERPIMEKEKYAGLRPSAYLTSKVVFLAALVAIQSLWMFAFVEFFWAFRGESITHLIFLILANAAMTSTCLAISAQSGSPEQSSLLSIYLVGFQLPLSGAVLALPTHFEQIIRPFISAYWAWSGSISSLDQNVYNAVKVVVDTTLTPYGICYSVLVVHIIVSLIIAYIGVQRSRWD